jgi:hypothetical protein
MERTSGREDFYSFFETTVVEEANRFIRAGWVHYGQNVRHFDNERVTVIILAWPNAEEDPIYPPDPSVHYD